MNYIKQTKLVKFGSGYISVPTNTCITEDKWSKIAKSTKAREIMIKMFGKI